MPVRVDDRTLPVAILITLRRGGHPRPRRFGPCHHHIDIGNEQADHRGHAAGANRVDAALFRPLFMKMKKISMAISLLAALIYCKVLTIRTFKPFSILLTSSSANKLLILTLTRNYVPGYATCMLKMRFLMALS